MNTTWSPIRKFNKIPFARDRSAIKSLAFFYSTSHFRFCYYLPSNFQIFQCFCASKVTLKRLLRAVECITLGCVQIDKFTTQDWSRKYVDLRVTYLCVQCKEFSRATWPTSGHVGFSPLTHKVAPIPQLIPESYVSQKGWYKKGDKWCIQCDSCQQMIWIVLNILVTWYW